jgi:hypothetical protein
MASVLGMLIAPLLSAEERGRLPVQGTWQTVDVALDQQQLLRGHVTTSNGAAAGGTSLSLWQAGKLQQQTQADEQGRFQFTLRRGGNYQLVVGNQLTAIRVWTAEAAPPGCVRQLVVVNGDVLRAQSGKVPYMRVNPWLVAGVVAAAVAIPVVLSNNRSDRGDGS